MFVQLQVPLASVVAISIIIQGQQWQWHWEGSRGRVAVIGVCTMGLIGPRPLRGPTPKEEQRRGWYRDDMPLLQKRKEGVEVA